MSAESTPPDPNSSNEKKVWKNPTVVVAIIGAVATIAAAAIGAGALILSNRQPEPSPTVEPPVATVEPSPTVEVVQIDSMDDLAGWQAFTDGQGSSLAISSKPGQTDRAIELFFTLNESGYVGVTRDVSPGTLVGSDGLAFYLKGSGEPNTVEFKLLYAEQGGVNPVFSVNWYAGSVTDDWIRLEADYDQFACWEATGCDPGSTPDPALVTRIDFAVSNKPGDVPGTGMVLLDSIEAIYR